MTEVTRTAAIENAGVDVADRAARELDDALYYLQHDCEPCAERHFRLAMRHGATPEDVQAIRELAAGRRPDQL